MRRHLVFLASFCALALIAILSLRPTEAVRLEGSLAELTPEAALDVLDRAAENGSFSENLALIYSRLALGAGDPAKARRALSRIAAQEGLNALGEEHLSEVERMAGDLAKASRHLQRAYRQEPTEARRLKLGLWARLLRDRMAELQVLQSVSPDKLTGWEVERLADLLLQAGRIADVEALYRQTTGIGGGNEADRLRASLVGLLAETGRLDAAMAEVRRWFVAEAPDQHVLEITLPVLLDRGALGEAFALARLSQDMAPESSHVLLPLFARSGHRATVLALQDRWLRGASRISADEWKTLAELAAGSGDLRGLRTALAIQSVPPKDPLILEQVFLQFLRFQGPDSLWPYLRFMTAGQMDSAPLVGAAAMRAAGRSDLVYRYLVAAARQPMIDWDRDIWMGMARQFQGTDAYRQLMSDPAIGDGFRIALADRFILAADPAEGP